MDEFKTEKAVYTANDFSIWKNHSMLEITPKFQRRKVWRTPARSYFIDTLLRGMTVPPLYLRLTQNKDKTLKIREVVDGQQRIRSVLDFAADGFKLSKSLHGPWRNKKFSQLSKDEQDRVMEYGFTTEIFKGISDKQVYEVFCRRNMNGIPLNKQELRNGKYFGFFKQACLDLSLAYLTFWRNHQLFSEIKIARMHEVELVSELIIAANKGMQDKKDSIDGYYDEWDSVYPSQDKDEKRFRDVMSALSEVFSRDGLAECAFSRPPLFYSLYCVVYHRMYSLPGVTRSSPRKKLSADERESLKDATYKLSDVLANSKDPIFSVPTKFAGFVAACQGQSDNIMPRRARFNALYSEAF